MRKYPVDFIVSFIIRLQFHKIKNSIANTIAAAKYLLISSIEAILASSCRLNPPKMIEKKRENTAKKAMEYA